MPYLAMSDRGNEPEIKKIRRLVHLHRSSPWILLPSPSLCAYSYGARCYGAMQFWSVDVCSCGAMELWSNADIMQLCNYEGEIWFLWAYGVIELLLSLSLSLSLSISLSLSPSLFLCIYVYTSKESYIYIYIYNMMNNYIYIYIYIYSTD